MSENAATLQYIASLAPRVLQPLPCTSGYYKVQNILSYVGTEMHSTVGKLFNPRYDPAFRANTIELYNKKLAYLNDNILAVGNDYTVENKLSIADIYLFIILSMSPHVGIDNSAYPNVAAFCDRIAGLEQIKAAIAFMATNPTSINCRQRRHCSGCIVN